MPEMKEQFLSRFVVELAKPVIFNLQPTGPEVPELLLKVLGKIITNYKAVSSLKFTVQ